MKNSSKQTTAGEQENAKKHEQEKQSNAKRNEREMTRKKVERENEIKELKKAHSLAKQHNEQRDFDAEVKKFEKFEAQDKQTTNTEALAKAAAEKDLKAKAAFTYVSSVKVQFGVKTISRQLQEEVADNLLSKKQIDLFRKNLNAALETKKETQNVVIWKMAPATSQSITFNEKFSQEKPKKKPAGKGTEKQDKKTLNKLKFIYELEKKFAKDAGKSSVSRGEIMEDIGADEEEDFHSVDDRTRLVRDDRDDKDESEQDEFSYGKFEGVVEDAGNQSFINRYDMSLWFLDYLVESSRPKDSVVVKNFAVPSLLRQNTIIRIGNDKRQAARGAFFRRYAGRVQVQV